MSLNARQEVMLEKLRQHGEVEVDHLAKALGVTTQTVRRDLGELCDQGLALRVHGGAKPAPSTRIRAYEERQLNNMHAKGLVAREAARLIPNGASVAVNIGTTTEQVAEALRLHKDLMVFSNNMNIISILRGARLRSLTVIGGEVRMSDGAVIGEGAVASINQYKVDFAVIGASSLDADGAVLDFDPREVAVAKAIVSNARQRILVADVSKFQNAAPFRICHIADLDHVILNARPPDAFIEAARQGNTNLIITETAHADTK
ncbi:DeoR/GlpR family DNA-binding transcription regulator [Halocynthiibacter namhaensis]|uniref:DeoR/GlpR family DNA-binding transcription regulator n=1 Tax=Halocynthiibacter namhaensis TaxID=1290553 RepID=UPI00192E3193|nr:DeoR/GlpR family DNA-binding transcription regulator [Halocynthiibacter namhaensis]